MNQLESVSHEAILDWLQRARPRPAPPPGASCSTTVGSTWSTFACPPCFWLALNAARSGSKAKRPTVRLRERAYRVKIALAERLARLRSQPVAPTDVLFWPRGPAHLEDMQAVWRVLVGAGLGEPRLACQAKPFEGLRAPGNGARLHPGGLAEANPRGSQRRPPPAGRNVGAIRPRPRRSRAGAALRHAGPDLASHALGVAAGRLRRRGQRPGSPRSISPEGGGHRQRHHDSRDVPPRWWRTRRACPRWS